MEWVPVRTKVKQIFILHNCFLISEKYTKDILGFIVLSYRVLVGESFIFIDENARPYRANRTYNWFDVIQPLE